MRDLNVSRAWRWTAGAVLLVICLALPAFDPSRYTMSTLNVTLIYIIVLISLNMLFGLAGQVSLGHGALFAVGAYTSAFVTATLHQPFVLGMLSAIFTGALAGVLIGAPALRLKSHYLAFATLAFGAIVQLLIVNIPSITHGSDGFTGIPPPSLFGWELKTSGEVYYLLVAFALFAMGLMWNVKRSRLGRALESIREDELAAQVAGVDVAFHKIFVFVTSSALAALAGGLYAHLFAFISPDVFGLGLSVQLFAMVIVGGAGTILGSVIGAVLLTLLPEWLRFSKASYGVIYGLGILFLVIFMPDGVVGGAGRLATHMRLFNGSAGTSTSREAVRRA